MNSFDASISCKHVNDQNVVNLMDNQDAEDIQSNSLSDLDKIYINVPLSISNSQKHHHNNLYRK